MHRQKGIAPILIVLFIALGISGYLLYQKQTTKSVAVPQTSPSPVTSPAPTGAGETATWKAYTNSEHKISFKYPKNWNISNENNAIEISNGSSRLRFQTSRYPSIDFDKLYEKPDRTIDQNPVFIRTKIKNLEIDGYKATMYSSESTAANQNKSFDISVYVIRGAPITMISGQTDPSSKGNLLSVFDQILSTFKFLP